MTMTRYGRPATRRAILEYLRDCRHSPTQPEIAEAVGLSSKDSIRFYLRDMAAHGEVAYHGKRVYVPDAEDATG